MTTNNDYMGFVPIKENEFTYECLPAGSYDYVVHGIVGLGLREKKYEGKVTGTQPVIKILFEIPDQIREDGKTELLSVTLPPYSTTNSRYRAFCNTLFGGNLTDEAMNKLCLASGMKELLGKTGTLTVSEWASGKGRSVDAKGFYPLHPKAPKPEPTREFVFFNPFNPDISVFKNNLTFYTRKAILEALNADQFSPELAKAHEEAQKEFEASKEENSAQTTKPKAPEKAKEEAPWGGNTEAIQ